MKINVGFVDRGGKWHFAVIVNGVLERTGTATSLEVAREEVEGIIETVALHTGKGVERLTQSYEIDYAGGNA
jgi:hypothetical protein